MPTLSWRLDLPLSARLPSEVWVGSPRTPDASSGRAWVELHAGQAQKDPRQTRGFVVGDTGIEPVTSSVSGKRATAAPIARTGPSEDRRIEVGTGFEPAYTALQAVASPLGHPTARG